MTKKKIAIIYSGGRYFGGLETYLLNLFNNYDKSKVELVLFSLGEWELTSKIDQNDIRIYSKKRISIKSIIKMQKELNDSKFDLISTHGTVSNAYGRILSFLTKIPCITTVHSDPYFDYPNPIIRFIYREVDRLTRFETNKYIVVSDFLKKILLKTGISSKKITVIPNGIELRSKDIVRKKNKTTIVGSIGRLHQVKGFHNLINAVKILENEKFLLKIAGSGEEKSFLEEQIKLLGLKDKVELLGFVDDLNLFFSALDIYIQPSLAEGFGLSVIEAMDAGLPVIVTPKGGLPEIIKDGKTGILSGDASAEALAASLKLLLEDKDLRTEIAQNGKEYVRKEYDVKKWADKTINAYLESVE